MKTKYLVPYILFFLSSISYAEDFDCSDSYNFKVNEVTFDEFGSRIKIKKILNPRSVEVEFVSTPKTYAKYDTCYLARPSGCTKDGKFCVNDIVIFEKKIKAKVVAFYTNNDLVINLEPEKPESILDFKIESKRLTPKYR